MKNKREKTAKIVIDYIYAFGALTFIAGLYLLLGVCFKWMGVA